MAGKICLTGGSGFLGWAFQAEGGAEEYFLPLRRPHPHLAKGRILESWQGEDWESIFKREKVVAVINTAAMSDPAQCDAQPVESNWVNVEWPLLLGNLCRKMNIPLVHFSSDLVFNGREKCYGDHSVPSPLSLYGKQKAEVESRLMEIYPQAWVCRLPLLFGESGPESRNGWAHWIVRAKKGERQPLFVDEFRSTIRSRQVARFVLSRLGELDGLMNLGGPEPLSRYEMGMKVCEVFRLETSNIIPTKLAEAKFLSPRPPSLVLDSSRARSEGLGGDFFKEELEAIKAEGGWVRA